MDVTLWTFVLLTLAMTASGALSVLRKRRTTGDYLLASREMPPWLAALSTVATNNSGFMFIGMIAYTYREGLETVWMMVGWILGDLVLWLTVYPRLRRRSQAESVASLPGLLAGEGPGRRAVVLSGALVTLVFLTVYAAAQLEAGGTALQALFGWDARLGALVGVVIVIIYSYAGGIRADIWTDAAQSFVMIVAMVMILGAGIDVVGGWAPLMAELGRQDPALVNWWPEDVAFGGAAFVAGFMFAGFTAVGQPHLMTRIMALRDASEIGRTAVYYFAWYVPFFLGAIGVGLYCRAILPDLAALPLAAGMAEPTELALPLLTLELLPGFFVGLALAGLFAATVSTADSQIIVCSGALTQDLVPRWAASYAATKIATLAVALAALGIALWAPEGVFGLVVVAWSALGASLGPVVVLRLFGLRNDAPTALTMMVAAIATVALWTIAGLGDSVFPALPGVLAAFGVFGVARLLRRASAPRQT
jgi:sodium/proline symporter